MAPGMEAMLSSLCKNPEGTVSRVLVEGVKDRERNTLHAVNVHEAEHGSRPAPNLDKASLDHIGRAQSFPPEVLLARWPCSEDTGPLHTPRAVGAHISVNR